MPVPEVRNNLELLGRMLERHLKMEQAMGYLPSGGLYSAVKGDPLGDDNSGDDRGYLTLVKNLAGLPEDQFAEVLKLALGPPPPGTEPVDTVIDVTRVRADDG
jgi:hypothetical protein